MHAQDGPFRVLVIDDNRDQANVLSLLLRKRGSDVQAIYDGTNALGAAGEFEPECIVLDIGMPGIDGYELARRFRADERFARTPLIAHTAYTDAEKTTAAGFDFHFVKAGNWSALLALIEQVKVLRTRLENMDTASEGQTGVFPDVKDLIHEVKDLKTELKEEVRELKEELREVKEEVKDLKDDLDLIQGQGE